MERGFKSGNGTLKYASGNVFVGTFVSDKREGEGVMTCASTTFEPMPPPCLPVPSLCSDTDHACELESHDCR